MRGIVPTRAQQQEHEIGEKLVRGTEVLRRLETREDAEGLDETVNRRVGDRNATPETER
jgi:hypothetical protein